MRKLAIAEGDLEAARKEYALSTQKLHLAEMEKVKQETEYETALEQMLRPITLLWQKQKIALYCWIYLIQL